MLIKEAQSKATNLGATPQMGWNSWNKFGCDVSETLIKETIDAIVNLGLGKFGYNYVNVDDCWQAQERDSNGQVVADPTRFPNGMKYLADYAHSKGLRFGLYSSAGYKTCQGRPASLGLEDIDAESYAAWEVDYLKYDNCYTDGGLPEHRYRAMQQALDKVDRDIFYSLCEWGRENPATWAGGISNSWRVSGDIQDKWHSFITRAAIDAPLWRYAGAGGWNDPDMLEVGNGGCSLTEYQYHFSLWAMLKAPMIIGNDVRTLSPGDSVMSIIANDEVIAINQDSLGRQGRRVWSDTAKIQNQLNVGRLIATQCNDDASAYLDAPADQQWAYDSETMTIKSTSENLCLQEYVPSLPASKLQEIAHIQDLDHTFGLFGVGLSDCSNATKWQVQGFGGGSVVSQSSGRCLEVSRFDWLPIVQGKRIQTGRCEVVDVGKDRAYDRTEHQAWTLPHGKMRNLYERQCLTLDRDAPFAHNEEIWSVPLEGNAVAVMLGNMGKNETKITATWSMLGLDGSTKMTARDLWLHEDYQGVYTHEISATVAPHGVVLLKLTPAGKV